MSTLALPLNATLTATQANANPQNCGDSTYALEQGTFDLPHFWSRPVHLPVKISEVSDIGLEVYEEEIDAHEAWVRGEFARARKEIAAERARRTGAAA